MGWAKADAWCTPSGERYAKEIADINGLYCGPTVVGWIAAVWNIDVQGRQYDYLSLKSRFPDGPRRFFGKPLGFESSLNDILQQETNGELCLSKQIMRRYGSIHDQLEDHDMPIIICMYPDQITLHYVTLYKSQKKKVKLGLDKIQFYWQDNGLYGSLDDGNPGLYKTVWREVGQSVFTWGAHRVRRASSSLSIGSSRSRDKIDPVGSGGPDGTRTN